MLLNESWGRGGHLILPFLDELVKERRYHYCIWLQPIATIFASCSNLSHTAIHFLGLPHCISRFHCPNPLPSTPQRVTIWSCSHTPLSWTTWHHGVLLQFSTNSKHARPSVCTWERKRAGERERRERRGRKRERENFVHATLMMFLFSSSLKTPEDHDGTLKLECQLCRGRVPYYVKWKWNEMKWN